MLIITGVCDCERKPKDQLCISCFSEEGSQDVELSFALAVVIKQGSLNSQLSQQY
jgi:hypothetical protein